MEDKKLSVFISQPMGGMTKEEILERRNTIIAKVVDYFQSDDIYIQPTVFDITNKPEVKNEPLYWLSKSLEKMADSDVVIMATGWENARGCRIEYDCAKRYSTLVLFEDTKYITRDELFEVDNDTVTGD